jgi:hypothetical protein
MPVSETKKIKVIKVEGKHTPRYITPSFPPAPRLYVELLENKDKVKPELRKKEFISKNFGSLNLGNFPSLRDAKSSAQQELSSQEGLKFIDDINDSKYFSRVNTKENYSSSNDIPLSSNGKPMEKKYLSPGKQLKVIDFTNIDSQNNVSSNKEDDMIGYTGSIKTSSKYRDKKHKSKYRESRDKSHESGYETEHENDRRDERSDRRDERSERRDERSDRRDERSDRRDERSERSERRDEYKKPKEEDGLMKLLKGESSGNNNTNNNSTSSILTTGIVGSSLIAGANIPPSLEEINSGKVSVDANGVRNLDYITPTEEQEATKKRDLLYKFKLLKKKYSQGNIPEFSEHTDIRTLQREFESISKQIEIDVKVAKYKKWLFFAFMGLEFVIKNFFSYQDIIGLANHQSECINEYESLLVEIGEKNYIVDEKQYPVELRLFGAVCMNTAIFVFGRIVEKHLGAKIMSGFSGMMNNQPNQQNQNMPPPQKKKMQGPDLDDIEDLTDKKFN